MTREDIICIDEESSEWLEDIAKKYGQENAYELLKTQLPWIRQIEERASDCPIKLSKREE